MPDDRFLSRDQILAHEMKPIEVTIEPDLQLRLRALTVADADYLVDLHRKRGQRRDEIVRVIHHQLESHSLAEEEIRSWDDRQVLAVFRAWAGNENTLDVDLAVEAGFDEAVEAIEGFSREWARDLESLTASPVVALANAAGRGDLDRFTDPLGLGKLARQIREMEEMSRGTWDPGVLKGIVAGMQSADLARRLDIPLSLSRHLAEIRSPATSVWGGISLGEQLSALQKAVSSFEGVNSIRALSMTRTTLLAESALVGVDLATLGRRLSGSVIHPEVLTNAVRGHLQAYGDLVADLSGSVPEIDARLAYELPAVEAFNEAEMARMLTGPVGEDEAAVERRERSGEIADELETEFPDLLRGLDPELVRLWEGARQARRGDNVDRSRHVGVSLRTLFDDVMNHIAPEKQVKQWCEPGDFLENGRVKREARFRYVSRNLKYRRVKTAFEADMNALVAAYGVLNGLHEGSLDLSARELGLVILRIESALRWAIIASQEG